MSTLRLVLRRIRRQLPTMAAVVALILITTVLLATLAQFTGATGDAAAQTALDTWQRDGRTTLKVDAQPDARSRIPALAALDSDLAPLPGAATETSQVSVSYALPGKGSGGDPPLMTFWAPSDLAAHAKLTAGAWPAAGSGASGPVQVAVPRSAADALKLSVGSQLSVSSRITHTPVVVSVVGVYAPTNTQEQYWQLDPLQGLGEHHPAAGANGFDSYGPFAADATAFDRATAPVEYASLHALVSPRVAHVGDAGLGSAVRRGERSGGGCARRHPARLRRPGLEPAPDADQRPAPQPVGDRLQLPDPRHPAGRAGVVRAGHVGRPAPGLPRHDDRPDAGPRRRRADHRLPVDHRGPAVHRPGRAGRAVDRRTGRPAHPQGRPGALPHDGDLGRGAGHRGDLRRHAGRLGAEGLGRQGRVRRGAAQPGTAAARQGGPARRPRPVRRRPRLRGVPGAAPLRRRRLLLGVRPGRRERRAGAGPGPGADGRRARRGPRGAAGRPPRRPHGRAAARASPRRWAPGAPGAAAGSARRRSCWSRRSRWPC